MIVRRQSPWQLPADRAGASAVEFALIAGLLTALLFGALDIYGAYAMNLALEQAAGRTAQLVTAPGTVALSYTNLPAEATSAYGATVEKVVTSNWLECDGVVQSSFTGTCATTAQTARYVSIALTDEYVPIMGWGRLFSGHGPNNGLMVTGDAVVRIQ
jgi:Flp pilus assembly protein TadG